MGRIKKGKIFIALLAVVGFVGIISYAWFFNSQKAVAAANGKVTTANLINCYNSHSFKTPLKNSSFNGSSGSFLQSGTQVFDLATYSWKGCEPFVADLVRSKTTIPNTGASSEEIGKFTSQLGYTKSGGTTDKEGKCLYYTYTFHSTQVTDTKKSPGLCVSSVNSDGTIASANVTFSTGFGPFEYQNLKTTTNSDGSTTVSVELDCNLAWFTTGGCKTHSFTTGKTKWNDFIREITDDIELHANSQNGVPQGWEDPTLTVDGSQYTLDGVADGSVMKEEPMSASSEGYSLNDKSLSTITKTLLGSSTTSQPTFSEAEKYNIYQDYLTKFYNVEAYCDWSRDEANIKMSNEGYKYVKYGSSASGCYVKPKDHKNYKIEKNDKVSCIENGVFGTACGFDEIAAYLAATEVTEEEVKQAKEEETKTGGATDPRGSTKTSGGSGSEDCGEDCEKSCDEMMDNYLADGEKIGSMQWILCPTMDNTKYTASWVDNITDSWLVMDPRTYDDDEGKVKGAWDIIRNLSNTVMIVFLLVIIFSQLTGYGIDNYGIKKMLPRLIVMAIIVNLSYFICVMAVDLSNILGTGLRSLFGEIGNSLGAVDNPSYIGGATVGMFAAASGGSASIGAATTAISLGASVGVAIIIAVIVLALIILVAVMILFLMLGVRLIIVIICIIISPLAFASFILPNTQNFCKKWWEAFKAALIIYPICGLLAGISHLLRNIFQGMDLPIGAIAIAMIMPYLGFFLIPTLLKSAIAALGKLGGALTSMGNTIRNGGKVMGHAAGGAIKNSERFKGIQNEALRKRQQQNAERTISKMDQIRDKGKELNPDQTRRLARAHETIRKLGNEDIAAQTILADREYGKLALESSNPNDQTLMSEWKTAWKNGDTDKMNALTNVITSRHGPGGVNAMASALAEDGMEIFNADGSGYVNDNVGKSFEAFRLNMQQNTALGTAMQNKASDVFQMVSSGGFVEHKVVDANGNISKVTTRANLAVHSANNTIATQTKDWATQSSGTLRRAAASGALSATVAREILSSTDPTVQSGIKSDAAKREILEAAASGQLATAKDSESSYAAQAASMQWNPNTKAPDLEKPDGMSDKSYIQNAAANYRAEQERVENDRATQEQAKTSQEQSRMEANTKAVNRLADAVEKSNNDKRDGNSGQGFSDGAGI